jgi:hypothetical protein
MEVNCSDPHSRGHAISTRRRRKMGVRDTESEHVTIWMTNEEHVALAVKKTRLKLTQSETVILALRLLEDISKEAIEKHLERKPTGVVKLKNRK